MKGSILAAAMLVLLAACSDTPDGARRDRAQQAAQEYAARIAELDALLADAQRAQRWRSEQTRWAGIKEQVQQEKLAERAKAISAAAAGHPEFLATVLELWRRGAHGPAGTVPAALVAEVKHSTVLLRNVTREPLRVNAWRLLANARGIPMDHCALMARDHGQQRFDPELAPGAALHFHNAEWEPCNRGDEKTPLELEIRRGDELVWVTDTRVHDVLRVPPDAVDEVLRIAAEARRD